MSDGMGRELVYLSSHATNRYFIPNWGIHYYFMPFTFMVVMLLSTSMTWILYHCKPFRKYILGIVDKYVQNNVDK